MGLSWHDARLQAWSGRPAQRRQSANMREAVRRQRNHVQLAFLPRSRPMIVNYQLGKHARLWVCVRRCGQCSVSRYAFAPCQLNLMPLRLGRAGFYKLNQMSAEIEAA